MEDDETPGITNISPITLRTTVGYGIPPRPQDPVVYSNVQRPNPFGINLNTVIGPVEASRRVYWPNTGIAWQEVDSPLYIPVTEFQEPGRRYMITKRVPKTNKPLKTLSNFPTKPWTNSDELMIRKIVATDQILDRKNMVWGTAPKYNEQYRRIRWPHGDRSSYRNTTQYQINVKSTGRWDADNTQRFLMMDLKRCMNLNIPFETKTLRYNPLTTSLYIKGSGCMEWDIMKQRPINFTYGGTYDKVVSMFLRRFGINVGMIFVDGNRKRELYYTPTPWAGVITGMGIMKVDLDTIYHIPYLNSLVMENNRISSVDMPSFVFNSGIMYNESFEIPISKWLALEGIYEPKEPTLKKFTDLELMHAINPSIFNEGTVT